MRACVCASYCVYTYMCAQTTGVYTRVCAYLYYACAHALYVSIHTHSACHGNAVNELHERVLGKGLHTPLLNVTAVTFEAVHRPSLFCKVILEIFPERPSELSRYPKSDREACDPATVC